MHFPRCRCWVRDATVWAHLRWWMTIANTFHLLAGRRRCLTGSSRRLGAPARAMAAHFDSASRAQGWRSVFRALGSCEMCYWWPISTFSSFCRVASCRRHRSRLRSHRFGREYKRRSSLLLLSLPFLVLSSVRPNAFLPPPARTIAYFSLKLDLATRHAFPSHSIYAPLSSMAVRIIQMMHSKIKSLDCGCVANLRWFVCVRRRHYYWLDRVSNIVVCETQVAIQRCLSFAGWQLSAWVSVAVNRNRWSADRIHRECDRGLHAMSRNHRASLDDCTDDHLWNDNSSLRCTAPSLVAAHFSLRLAPDDCTESSNCSNMGCIGHQMDAMRIALVSQSNISTNSIQATYAAWI